MKKHFLVTTFAGILLFVAISCQAQPQKRPYEIKGTIKGLGDKTMIIFGQYYADKQYVRDTVYTDAAGNFTLTSKDSVSAGMFLVILPEKRFFDIILNENFKFSFQTHTEDLIGNMKFKNSPENTAFYEYLSFIKTQNEQVSPIRQQLNRPDISEEEKNKLSEQLTQTGKRVKERQTAYISKNPNHFFTKVLKSQLEVEVPEPKTEAELAAPEKFKYHYYINHYWNNVDLTDERLLNSPVIHSKLNHFFTQVIIPMPDTIIQYADRVIEMTRPAPEVFKYVVWFLTNHYERSPYLGMDAVFVHLVETYYASGQVFWLTEPQLKRIIDRAMALKPLLIGKTAPDITAFDPKGQPITMSKIEADFLVVYFWDSDCSHCKKVTPALHKVFQDYKDKGLKVFALNTEGSNEPWLNYVEKNQLTWINVNDRTNRSGFRDNYDIFATPVMYVLDKDKKIIAKKITTEQLEELLKREMGL